MRISKKIEMLKNDEIKIATNCWISFDIDFLKSSSIMIDKREGKSIRPGAIFRHSFIECKMFSFQRTFPGVPLFLFFFDVCVCVCVCVC